MITDRVLCSETFGYISFLLFQLYLTKITAQGMTEADLIKRIRAVGESHGGPAKEKASGQGEEDVEGEGEAGEGEETGGAGVKRKRSKKKKKKEKESNETA